MLPKFGFSSRAGVAQLVEHFIRNDTYRMPRVPMPPEKPVPVPRILSLSEDPGGQVVDTAGDRDPRAIETRRCSYEARAGSSSRAPARTRH